jgi:pimeloyl-ACP methyl ester carboxylesterase
MWYEAVQHLTVLSPALPIVLVEFPGFGASDLNPEWTMDAFAKSLHDELSSRRISQIILGGCSMGGYAVLGYCKKFSSTLAGMILSNTKASADTEKAKEDREVFAQDAESRGAVAAIERLLPKFLIGDAEIDLATREQRLRDWIGQANPYALAAALRAMALRPDSTQLLSSITAPTLVIAGEADPLIPLEEMESMASSIRGARLVVMEKTGHLAPVDQPTAWARAVVEFIDQHGLDE